MFAQNYDCREICRKVKEDRRDAGSVTITRDIGTERLDGPRAAAARQGFELWLTSVNELAGS